MKKMLPFLILLSGCYKVPQLSGFDQQAWLQLPTCTSTHVAQAEAVESQQDVLLGLGQAPIKALLGAPAEHELYYRNQKFFHYDLTPPGGCDGLGQKRLSIRFDALDRVKEVRVTQR